MSASIQKIDTPAHSAPVAITPMDMLDRAVQAGQPIEVLTKLMDLQDRWEKTQARKAFDVAIARAKADIPVIVKTATGHNSKKYADFAGIARVIDPVISRHGLSYRFRTAQADKISVTCVLSHEAGHFEETTLAGPADQTGNKNAIQAIGSTLTYLQRYSLVQALGLAASDDDDGKAGGVGSAVSEDQATEIRDMLASIDNKETEARFLKWLKVDRVGDIPAARFDEAMAALKKAAQS